MARILVVDDSRLTRRMVRDLLEKGGHEVEDWDPPPPEELYLRLKDIRHQLLVVDHNMPRYTGLQLFRMARTYRPGFPAILLTANQDPEVLAEYWNEGINAVLPKPSGLTILLDSINEILPKDLAHEPQGEVTESGSPGVHL